MWHHNRLRGTDAAPRGIAERHGAAQPLGAARRRQDVAAPPRSGILGLALRSADAKPAVA
jgi:hypothetical protein